MADANRFDTSLRKGDCWTLEVVWSPSEPVALTGYTAEFAIAWPRQRPGDTALVEAGEFEATPTVDIPTATFTVNIDADDTSALPNISIARYQLRAVAPDGCKTTIAVGTLKIEQDYIGA